MNFSDHLSGILYKAKEVADPKVKYKQLDIIEKNIMSFCNTPQTDSHIKQFFVARDEDGHTINFDEKIQFLKNEGFLDHKTNQYVVNPKYREFITVMPMAANKRANDDLSRVDAIIEDINKYEVGGLSDTQIIDKLIEKYDLSEKSAYDILKSSKHFSTEIKDVEADYSQSSNGDLGLGVVDRTEREEQRESLSGPKVSFNLKKKSSIELTSKKYIWYETLTDYATDDQVDISVLKPNDLILNEGEIDVLYSLLPKDLALDEAGIDKVSHATFYRVFKKSSTEVTSSFKLCSYLGIYDAIAQGSDGITKFLEQETGVENIDISILFSRASKLLTEAHIKTIVDMGLFPIVALKFYKVKLTNEQIQTIIDDYIKKEDFLPFLLVNAKDFLSQEQINNIINISINNNDNLDYLLAYEHAILTPQQIDKIAEISSKDALLFFIEEYPELFSKYKVSSNEVREANKKSILKKAYSYLKDVNKQSVNKNTIHYEAINYVRKFLANYRFPLSPTIKFNAIKNAAVDANNNLSGEVNISVEFKTLSNLRKRADISLPIVNGSFIEPSTITVDGQSFIISQSAIDNLTKSATIYNQANPRKNFLANPVDRIIENKYKDKKIPQFKKDIFSV